MSSSIKQDAMMEYLKKCVRCGQCRYVCPVLAETKKESTSPRGKVYLAGLVQKGEVQPTGKADQLLSLCLSCGACTAECPSGLPAHKIITSSRAIVARNKPINPGRLLFRSSFKAWPLLAEIPGFLWLFKQVMARNAGLETGKTALSQLPARSRPETKKTRLRVGYFLGCATNTLLPEVALNTVAVLQHLGCEVLLPRVHCCGLPLSTAGESDLAQHLLNQNHLLFKDLGLDAIITDCSSCSCHLTENNFGLNGQPVYELTEFLLNVLEPSPPALTLDTIPTICHEPCHLKYGRKITGQIQQVLNLIPEINQINIQGGSQCCGGGGTFALKHPQLSKAILTHSIETIRDSGAQRLITVCPSCTFQFRSKGIEVLHPAQILYQSYGLSDRNQNKYKHTQT